MERSKCASLDSAATQSGDNPNGGDVIELAETAAEDTMNSYKTAQESRWKGWEEISYGGYECVKHARAAEYLVRSWIEESYPDINSRIISYIIGLDSLKEVCNESITSIAAGCQDIRLRMDGLFEAQPPSTTSTPTAAVPAPVAPQTQTQTATEPAAAAFVSPLTDAVAASTALYKGIPEQAGVAPVARTPAATTGGQAANPLAPAGNPHG
uniref:Uncharacterized protein n=1 Tax=Chenopodium quinoa TaxID=63459 RepID=A0A803MX54_CHEQI